MILCFLAGLIVPSVAIPEQIVEPAHIAALIRQLDGDNFRTRERASKELRQIGLPALEFIEKVAVAPKSAELGFRAEKLIHDIHASTFKRGKVIDGVRITLSPCDKSYRAEKPILLNLEIENISDSDMQISNKIYWGWTQTYGPAKYVVRAQTRPMDFRMEIHQLSGAKVEKELRNPLIYHDGAPIPLKIGDSRFIEVPASMSGRPLRPGEYEVRVSWPTRNPIPRSNTVHFTVE